VNFLAIAEKVLDSGESIRKIAHAGFLHVARMQSAWRSKRIPRAFSISMRVGHKAAFQAMVHELCRLKLDPL